MKEVDLLLGPFADVHVDGLDAVGLSDLEALLEVPDQDILAWIIGGAPVPEAARSPVVERLLAHYRNA